jgi:hypothetical protein
MASATSAFAESVWPHSTHHPFGNVSSAVSAAAVSLGGHHDGVDPLDPLQIASSSSSLIPTDNFGSSAVNVHNNSDACNRETDSPEYKPSHFLTNGSSNQQQDHPSGRSGNPTRPSPDSGLTISDGVSSSGSPNQNIQSAHHLNSNIGMLGSPGSSPPPGKTSQFQILLSVFFKLSKNRILGCSKNFQPNCSYEPDENQCYLLILPCC